MRNTQGYDPSESSHQTHAMYAVSADKKYADRFANWGISGIVNREIDHLEWALHQSYQKLFE